VDTEQVVVILRDAGVEAARYLLEYGNDCFWTLAVVLKSDGGWLCLISHESDLIEPITVFRARLTVRLLDAPRHDDQAEYDQGFGYTIRELRRLVAAGEVIGAAVVSCGFNDPLPEDDEDAPVEAVWVRVECEGSAPGYWLLPYDCKGEAPACSGLVEGPVPEPLLFPRPAAPGVAN
jgi:hypothetical protein